MVRPFDETVYGTPEAKFSEVVTHEDAVSKSVGGRSVIDDRDPKNQKKGETNEQLGLF